MVIVFISATMLMATIRCVLRSIRAYPEARTGGSASIAPSGVVEVRG